MINSPRVCIQVQSVYIEAQSSPDNERYVFAYTVTIRNLGRAPVQLLGRYWLITNGNGTMQGHYEMIDENGVPFSIDIPVFRLALPTLIH